MTIETEFNARAHPFLVSPLNHIALGEDTDCPLAFRVRSPGKLQCLLIA